jgi:hypothetical protein
LEAKSFVDRVYRQFKDHFSSKNEKQPRTIKGLRRRLLPEAPFGSDLIEWNTQRRENNKANVLSFSLKPCILEFGE